MNDDDSNMLTTSFLDVITCGLGSILLLFFLMVAIKGEMQFDDGTQTEFVQDERTAAPLIILVTGQDSRPIWAAGVAEPWQASPGVFDHQLAAGPNYAVLYARQPPPRDWTLKLGPLAADARVNVQVIADGRRVIPAETEERKTATWKEGDFISVWPLPAGTPR
jgi:hypothetical protein